MDNQNNKNKNNKNNNRCNNDPHKYNLLFFKCLFSFDVISISEAFRGAVPGW